jgi:hypothetical protein
MRGAVERCVSVGVLARFDKVIPCRRASSCAAPARTKVCAVERDPARSGGAADPPRADARAFAFVHAPRDRFGVKRLCRVLITDSANYRAAARRDSRAGSRVTTSGAGTPHSTTKHRW